jgi:hypothetical protein
VGDTSAPEGSTARRPGATFTQHFVVVRYAATLAKWFGVEQLRASFGTAQPQKLRQRHLPR